MVSYYQFEVINFFDATTVWQKSIDKFKSKNDITSEACHHKLLRDTTCGTYSLKICTDLDRT